MFSQKTLYIVLIVIAALISSYFWGQALRILFTNYSLKEQIPVRIVQWEVEETGSDQYALKANYSFELNGRVYYGNTLFAKPLYLNQPSAIEALDAAARSKSWTAWFDRKNPTRSSLEKVSSHGVLFRAILATSVLLYFVFFVIKNYWISVERSSKNSNPI